jgi:hypothetical protein
MKHRHKLATQRRTASPSRRPEDEEAFEEQPQPTSSRAKKRARLEIAAEGGRPKHRLDKFRRGGRKRSNKYDIGGVAPPAGSPTTPGLADFISSPKVKPITAFVQKGIPPLDRFIGLNPKPIAPPYKGRTLPGTAAPSKAGGRIGHRKFDDGGSISGGSSSRDPSDPGGEIATANKGRRSTAEWIKDEIMGGTRPAYARGGRQRPRHYDDGGSIADASPIQAPNLAYGSGPPPPPRISDDGTPMAAAPPRANNPGFLNSLNAAQKRTATASRLKKLEGKGR